MASPDCEAIEKCIKDLLFKGNPSSEFVVESDLNGKPCHDPYSFDDRCLVSNIEGKTNVKSPFPSLSSTNTKCRETLLNQSNVSELIDLDVLTDFAAKHIDDSNFNASNIVLNSDKRILPHPELEDDCHTDINSKEKPGIAVLLDNISKEIQNSPNFLSMPENPLPTASKKSLNNNDCNPSPENTKKQNLNVDKKSARKKKKNQKKAAKEKKMEEKMASLYFPRENSNPSDSTLQNDLHKEVNSLRAKINASPSKKEDLKTPEKKNVNLGSEQESDIKMKKSAFSALGKEYSIIFQKNNCKFQCHLCNYNTDLKSSITRHLITKNHQDLKEMNDLDMMLPFLPEPLECQLEAITELLTNQISSFGLEKEDLQIREALTLKLKKCIQDHLPLCSVDVIGSSATGFGLKTSEVDFVLRVTTPDDTIPDTLENLYKVLLADPAYKNVVDDFKKKRPRIQFVDCETSLSCNIDIDNGSSLKLANLLSTYYKLDNRVLILGTALHYWAKLCQIDQQDKGTLPSFSFALLLVHFLQQVQPPVLPVLHELKEFSNTPEFYKEYTSSNTWQSKNIDSVGALWIKLFHFYNFKYKIGEHIVCIRNSKRILCSDRSWSTKFYAIEDPFMKRNLAYVIPTYQICHFIQQCFLKTYRYFAYPQLKNGSLKLLKTDSFNSFMLSECISHKPIIKEDLSEESEASEVEDPFSQSQLELEDHDPDIPLEDLISTVTNLSLNEAEPEDKLETSNTFTEVQPFTAVTSSPSPDNNMPQENVDKSKETVKSSSLILCHWDIEGKEFTKESFIYEFNARTFKGVKSVPLMCKLCKGTGHLKKDCPNDDIPSACLLPEMTTEFSELVTKVLHYIKDKNAVNDNDLKVMNAKMQDIESYIKQVFPDACLSLFGSFCNGFGFKNRSDMDFCLTFGDKEDGKDLDCADVIGKVAKQLRLHPNLENVVPVTSAKVPIVKFTCTDTGQEGDISLYNTLALANTEMLETYSRIDPRVQILGFALKYFAKILGICDASRGSLSSYAYILMVIYFLQQRTPPIIPVLQELHNEEKPSRLVEGWNVWFFRDIDELANTWSDYGKNKENLAELWLGLLSFYACDFNWKEYVVSIRQKSPVTRFKKLWISDQIAIEDPFELNHNLGAGLSRKMNSYILKAFLRGRERFGIPVPPEKMYTIHNREVAYLFDRRFLNSGCEPPHDRGCRNCGKIGHIAKNCPQEKACSYCGRIGHLVKTCPKKNKWRKSRDNDRVNNHEVSSPFDKKNNSEKKNSRGDQQTKSRDKSSTILNQNLVNLDGRVEVQRNFMQLGVPAHRLPPPGFSTRAFGANPPPGFKPNLPMHQNVVNYPPPFSIQQPHVVSPFSRSGKKTDVNSRSPPKQYTSSPPKNFPTPKPFHQLSDAPWPVGVRPGFHIERHQSPQGHHQAWRNRPHTSQDSHLMPHQSNQLQNVDHRLNRTASNQTAYNSNHLDRRW